MKTTQASTHGHKLNLTLNITGNQQSINKEDENAPFPASTVQNAHQ